MIFCCGVSSITPERSVITVLDQPAWFSCQGAAPTIIKTNYCCWWGKMFTCITLLCWLAVQGGDSFYLRPQATLISPFISRNAIIGNYKLLLDPPCLMETDEPEFVGNTYHMISQLSHDIEILTENWPIHNIWAAWFIFPVREFAKLIRDAIKTTQDWWEAQGERNRNTWTRLDQAILQSRLTTDWSGQTWLLQQFAPPPPPPPP